MKRLAIIFCSMLITINTLPVIAGNFVFADSVPDGYSPAGVSDQVDAFKSYCKSRNLAIEGSLLDAVTSFTTSAYNACCNTLGLDINELQYQIYKGTNTNAGKYFFTATGISAMNRIFSEFLQNNDIDIGDNVNKTAFDGYSVNGNLVYRFSGDSWGSGGRGSDWRTTKILQYGTDLLTNVTETVEIDGVTITVYNNSTYGNLFSNVTGFQNSLNYQSSLIENVNFTYSNYNYSDCWSQGHICYGMNSSGVLKLYRYTYGGGTATRSGTDYECHWGSFNSYSISGKTAEETTIYITTNNTTINNNTYEGDTIINNNGVVNKPNPTPTPIPDPNDNHSTTTNPVDPSDPDSDSNLSFPILDLDLPSIDWSIGDLSHKFPFSIPFDLYNMFSVLNTEPQTPEIKGNIDLGIYQWSIDWNLHQFDDTAELLRNVEFVGFIIGLIFITRNIIKG